MRRMTRFILIFTMMLTAAQARACATALLLAMDVSHSVDAWEYQIQTGGVADALDDPAIAEILVQERVALSVVQWSGASRQAVVMDWQIMLSSGHVANFSAAVRGAKRAFTMSNTAPAEAMGFALDRFASAPDCARQVLDVSGDGTPNAGNVMGVAVMRRRAQDQGVTINGLAIEGMGRAITNYYEDNIATPDGFVITARGHHDFADAMRAKILREISRVSG